MSSHDRRAAARRRAWGRGPVILKFEPLEGRELMAARPGGLPDLVAVRFDTVHNAFWGDSIHVVGDVENQGRGPANAPFKVDLYASPGQGVGRGSIYLGSVQMPGHMAPGDVTHFDQVVNLPPYAIATPDNGQTIFVNAVVDPDNAVPERSNGNNRSRGQGVDASLITITPPQPANLIGTAFQVDTPSTTWGDTLTVTAQVMNNSQGNAPPTRALLVLDALDASGNLLAEKGIGDLVVPALPAYATINVTQAVALPATAPSTMAGGTSYRLRMIPDADFQTSPAIPHGAPQGPGLDQTTLLIAPNPAVPPVDPTRLPDLAAASVQAPGEGITWNQPFQVSTTVQNLSTTTAAGPFTVRFLLTNAQGNTASALYLGDARVPGLAANTKQDVVQTISLPNSLPSNIPLAGVGQVRIVAVVDPEDRLDESFQYNNTASSAPIVLRLVDAQGNSLVPITPASSSPALASSVAATLGSPAPAGTLATTPATSPARAQPKKNSNVGESILDQLKSAYHSLQRHLKVAGKSNSSS